MRSKRSQNFAELWQATAEVVEARDALVALQQPERFRELSNTRDLLVSVFCPAKIIIYIYKSNSHCEFEDFLKQKPDLQVSLLLRKLLKRPISELITLF